ncbi:MAG: DUF1956 domain-containing protein [Treponema sp.]|nr:DUF1956 domain-containing protein [Treponema sp.]
MKELSLVKSKSLKIAVGGCAEEEFRHSTIREIAKWVKVNIVTINDRMAMDKNKSAEERLKSFIYTLVSMLLDKKDSPWFGQLFVRETIYAEHTKVLDTLTKKSVRSVIGILKNVIDELSGSKLSDEKFSLTTASIIAQGTSFYTNLATIPLLFDIDLSKDNIITILSDHITEFAINALQKWKK